MRLHDPCQRRPSSPSRWLLTAATAVLLSAELGGRPVAASPAPRPAYLALRQAVPDGTVILNDMNEISTIIPGDCAALCQPWLTAFGVCGQVATTIATCACTPTFLANLQTCTTCMTTQLTAAADPQAALPANVLTTVQAQCNVAAAPSSPLSSSSSTTSTTTTTTTTPAAVIPSTTTSTTTTTTPPATSTTPASSSSSTTPATPVQTGPVTITSVVAGSPFPTQTKAANAFAGATATRVGFTIFALAAAAGLVGVLL